jgi:hypothetical protein
MKSKLVSSQITAGVDDHIFIMVERPQKPTISLDISNSHGVSTLSVRSAGNGIASIRCDVGALKPTGGLGLTRFCPMCGEELNHFSSLSHGCKSEQDLERAEEIRAYLQEYAETARWFIHASEAELEAVRPPQTKEGLLKQLENIEHQLTKLGHNPRTGVHTSVLRSGS